MPTKLPKVILVDDHPDVLRQVGQLVFGEFLVVEALPNGRDLQSAVEIHQPDLLVLDISLPGASGLELARGLAGLKSPPRIVFLTIHADPDYAREAFDAGAFGYVVKPRLASDLLSALHAALEGSRFISPCPELEAAFTFRRLKP